MNIAIIVSSLKIGGAEKQAVLDANLLALKHRVCLIVFEDGPLKDSLDQQVEQIILAKGNYVKTALLLRRILRKREIDVVHASLFAGIVLSSLATLMTKIKVLWHFHSHEYDMPSASRWSFRLLAKLPGVKRIFFVSSELRKHFAGMGFPEKKQRILYNHSTLEGMSLPGQDPGHDGVNIGFIGRVVPIKRVEYLVDLAGSLVRQKGITDFRIHIVGDGASLPEIKKEVEKRALYRFFIFHGFQTRVEEYYPQFDIFVNPSSEECLSIAMIDAAISGLPIVAFDVGGNDEIVDNGLTGFIVNSPSDIIERCYELVSNQDLRMAQGKAGQALCREKFGPEKHLAALETCYQEICV